MDSHLVVYKASAGSGKTFRLATEYIKLILQNSSAYKNILAVTFTNKATAEMKNRILSELYGIANLLPDSKSYIKTICEETQSSQNEIREKASVALTLILHNYNMFRIETIDTFFQSVLKSMGKDLGLNLNFSIDINDDEVRRNVITKIIETSNNNKLLLDWLKSYIFEKIEEDKSWKIELDIETFYTKIISEKFKQQENEITKRLSDKIFLTKYKQELQEITKTETEKVVDCGNKFFAIIAQNGLTADDFKGKGNGIGSYFKKLINNNFLSNKAFNKTAQSCTESAENWSSKTSEKREKIIETASSQLVDLLQKSENTRQKSSKIINTCNLIGKNLNNLGLINDILLKIREYNADNNIFSLSDTSVLLAKIIGKNDTSFIFEKIGTTIKHVMIDEFQDTSELQWKNFEMLLTECLSQANKCLIVGDVKQAIYRWRNGNWQILNNIEKNKRLNIFGINQEILANSWRSSKNIVNFNNVLFEKGKEIINSDYKSDFGENCNDLLAAYVDADQICKRETCGFVDVLQIEKEKGLSEKQYKENTLEKTVETVEFLQKNGVKASDIAILVRKNEQGKDIARRLAKRKQENSDSQFCYNVVSSETFTLNSSIAINIIISALLYLNNNADTTSKANLILEYQKNVLKSDCTLGEIFEMQTNNLLPPEFIQNINELKTMPLYELIEKIFNIFELEKLNENAEYMFSFLDKTREFIEKEQADIATFTDYFDNKLREFSVETSSESEGIKIMTIHKAKGLEFHSLILPFCDWDMVGTSGGNKQNYIWCKTSQEPFAKIGLVPIDYKEEMQNSFFEADFIEETKLQIVDNLNILYVAATRAKNNLIMLIKKDDTAKTISRVIAQATKENNFPIGKIVESEEIKLQKSDNQFKKKSQTIELDYFPNNDTFTFRQSNKAKEFMKSNDENYMVRNRFINRGKLYHTIFSKIKSLNQLETTINELVFDGIISSAEREEISKYILNSIQKSGVTDWYNNKYTLFSECAIITKNKTGETATKRPDRVMISKTETIVVDFKFGKRHNTYRTQVLEYMDLMKEMEYPNISGFLWYVDENYLEKIKLQKL